MLVKEGVMHKLPGSKQYLLIESVAGYIKYLQKTGEAKTEKYAKARADLTTHNAITAKVKAVKAMQDLAIEHNRAMKTSEVERQFAEFMALVKKRCWGWVVFCKSLAPDMTKKQEEVIEKEFENLFNSMVDELADKRPSG